MFQFEDRPTRIQAYIVLGVSWLIEHKKIKWPFAIGAVIVCSQLLFMPWWGRMITLLGVAVMAAGTEVENLWHRIDGANTMAFLMEDSDHRS